MIDNRIAQIAFGHGLQAALELEGEFEDTSQVAFGTIRQQIDDKTADMAAWSRPLIKACKLRHNWKMSLKTSVKLHVALSINK